jgi:hypothetical protein
MKYFSTVLIFALAACAPAHNQTMDASATAALPPVLALANMFVPTQDPTPCDLGITVRLAGDPEGDKEFRVSTIYRDGDACDQAPVDPRRRTYKVTDARQLNGAVVYDAFDAKNDAFSLVDDRKSTFPHDAAWTATEAGVTYTAAEVDIPETSVGVRN